jgi:integrase
MAKKAPALTARGFAAWSTSTTLALPAELVDGAVPGLRVRRWKNGDITWSLSVMLNMKRVRIPLGAGLTLAEAREKAEAARKLVKAGVDPAGERKAALARAKDAMVGRGTLKRVIEGYFSTGDGRDLKSREVQEDHLKTVLADLLNRPALDVSAAELQSAVVDWSKRSVRAAQLAAAYMRPVARWAERLGMMKAGSDRLHAPKRRSAVVQKVLTAKEAVALTRVLSGKGFDLAAKMMLWTACRRGEVIGATWGEFDLTTGVWAITGSRRKNTRGGRMPDLIVPLPRQAVDALKTMKVAAQGERDNVPADELVVAGARGAALTQNWPRWSKEVAKRAGIGSVSPHVLRRTAATLLGELGEPPHITEAVLGHTIGSRLSAGYNQSRYAKEHRKALQRLADHLDALAAGKENIVPLRRLV